MSTNRASIGERVAAGATWIVALAAFLGVGFVSMVFAGQAGSSPGSAGPQSRNALCPVLTDEPIDPEKYTDYEGRRIYFCCGKCLREFLASPTSYLGNPNGASTSAASVGSAGDARGTEGRERRSIAAGTPGQGHSSEAGFHAHAEAGERRHGLEHLVSWGGKFHPMVVHFPVALLIGAALAELLALLRPALWLAHAARFCVLVGALGAVGAALLGLARASSGDLPSGLAHTVELHRWFGIGTAVWMSVTAVVSERGRVPRPNRWTGRYRLFLFVGTALIAVTGHLGATITHGPDYYAW